MFLFSAGMFTIHSVLPGLVNRLGASYRSVVNGLYLSAYYLGGTLGTFAPGYLLELGGWSAFIGGLLIIVGLALVSTGREHA